MPKETEVIPSAGAVARLPEGERARQNRTTELMLDLELPVRISLGTSQVPLKDVLKLTSGSILELNRALGDPVDVVVNNCVVAQGEIVVVEGNYGVRIQRISERARCAASGSIPERGAGRHAG
jgi:flagellar motor switch protein FliN